MFNSWFCTPRKLNIMPRIILAKRMLYFLLVFYEILWNTCTCVLVWKDTFIIVRLYFPRISLINRLLTTICSMIFISLVKFSSAYFPIWIPVSCYDNVRKMCFCVWFLSMEISVNRGLSGFPILSSSNVWDVLSLWKLLYWRPVFSPVKISVL